MDPLLAQPLRRAAVSLTVEGYTIAFVSAHLAAHEGEKYLEVWCAAIHSVAVVMSATWRISTALHWRVVR